VFMSAFGYRGEALILWRVMCAAARAMDECREDGDVR
jgi:hypothetical protein